MMKSIQANTTGTLDGTGAFSAFDAVKAILPTNHQRVSHEKITVSTLEGSCKVEQYSSAYQRMVTVSTTNAMADQAIYKEDLLDCEMRE